MKLPGALARLDADQHSYLISLLSMGKNDGEITDAIHEKGWLADVKRQTLLKNVNRWRRGKGQEAVMKDLADRVQTAPAKMKRQIDVVEEMTQLVLKQKERIKKLAAKEDPTPLLLDSVSSEMKTLLTALEKLSNLQIRTGLLRAVKTGEVESDYKDPELGDEEQEPVFSEEDRRFLQIVNSASQGVSLQ